MLNNAGVGAAGVMSDKLWCRGLYSQEVWAGSREYYIHDAESFLPAPHKVRSPHCLQVLTAVFSDRGRSLVGLAMSVAARQSFSVLCEHLQTVSSGASASDGQSMHQALSQLLELLTTNRGAAACRSTRYHNSASASFFALDKFARQGKSLTTSHPIHPPARRLPPQAAHSCNSGVLLTFNACYEVHNHVSHHAPLQAADSSFL